MAKVGHDGGRKRRTLRGVGSAELIAFRRQPELSPSFYLMFHRIEFSARLEGHAPEGFYKKTNGKRQVQVDEIDDPEEL